MAAHVGVALRNAKDYSMLDRKAHPDTQTTPGAPAFGRRRRQSLLSALSKTLDSLPASARLPVCQEYQLNGIKCLFD